MKYFAYGSNMWTRRVTGAERAPSAVALGVAEAPGFVVRFHKRGVDGSGKCTLRAATSETGTGGAAGTAYGVLFEVTAADLARLDAAEGVLTGHYRRCRIRLRRADGGVVEAETFVANEAYVEAGHAPFDWYRDLVVAGAREHGLPADYVDALARTPATRDPDAARAAPLRRLLE